MKKMKSTGERLLTDSFDFDTIAHLHRYALATALTKEKVVLDIASGEGYGTNLISKQAKEVIGVDISKEAISHARNKYSSKNLSFLIGSTDKIPCSSNYFDVVVSFETIEHHDRHEEMLLEVKRVLKPDGIIIISSPDKLNYTDRTKNKNPFHIKELYESDFKYLIMRHFKNSLFLKQRVDLNSVMLPENIPVEFESYDGTFDSVFIKPDYGPIYIISIASDNPLPKMKMVPFFYGGNIIDNIKKSWRYTIGNFLLSPVPYLKRIISHL